MTEDEMVACHHGLSGHDFEQTSGDGEGQGSLMCCSPWGHRFGHDLTTEQQPNLPGARHFLSTLHKHEILTTIS